MKKLSMTERINRDACIGARKGVRSYFKWLKKQKFKSMYQLMQERGMIKKKGKVK